jgi:hypothetical protein
MKPTLARVIATITLAALAVGLAPTVSAAPLPRATAKIDVHSVLAGTERVFSVTVSNPREALVTPIRSIRVGAPTSLFTIKGEVDTADAWVGSVTHDGAFVTFRNSNPLALLPGSSVTLQYTAQASRPAADESSSWSVATSSQTAPESVFTPADRAGAGALGTRVRTLEILGITVNAPAPIALKPTFPVTAGQDGVEVTVQVANIGSAVQTVAATLTGTSATVTPGSAPATVAPGEVGEFDFGAVFGDATGHQKLQAFAAAGASEAAPTFKAYRAFAPFGASAVTGTLLPADVVQGRTYDFTVALDPTGDVPVTIDAAASALRFGDGGFSAPLLAPTAIDGRGANVPLTFAPSVVGAIANGSYPVSLHLVGTDKHGASVVRDLALGTVRVDDQLPVADVALEVPAPRVGEQPAATNGTEIDFAGTVTDGATEACATCTITAAALEALDATGATVGSFDVTSAIFNNGGVLSGSATVPVWPATAVRTRLAATVVDPTALRSESVSSALDVDTVAPAIEDASTTSLRTITATLTEEVALPAGDFVPADFTCTGPTLIEIVGAELAPDARSIVISLSRDLGRDETPACTYRPTAGRASDRVGLPLANATFTPVDGLAPAALTLTAVDEGTARADGSFLTSSETPELSLAGAVSGHSISVYEDDGDGVLDGDDATRSDPATASGDTIDVQTTSFGAIDRTVKVFVQATDAAGNLGEVTVALIELDFTAPALATATLVQDNRTVTATFPETLEGPAANSDWAVLGVDEGANATFGVGSITIVDNVVTLTVDDPRFNPVTGDTLTAVRYDVEDGQEARRLADLAGNLLADATQAL